MGRTFDAARVDLHHPGFKVSVFASSVTVGRDGVIDHHIQGNNLHGVYGSFTHIIPHATLEPYVLWRLAPGNAGLPETAGRGHLNEVTTGFRLAGKLPSSFDYDIEMDKQTGSLGPSSIDAWAGHWNVGRTFSTVPAKPRVFIESNFASGTRNPNSHTWSTFDQIYPSSHDKLGFADQVGWRNIQQLRTGVGEAVGKKWRLKQTYEDLWLATVHDSLYASSGAVSITAHPTASSRHIGSEIDAVAEYQVNPAMTLGFGYAHLFTGQFLNQVSPGKDYNYPFTYMSYRF
jgi:hypothetical protein